MQYVVSHVSFSTFSLVDNAIPLNRFNHKKLFYNKTEINRILLLIYSHGTLPIIRTKKEHGSTNTMTNTGSRRLQPLPRPSTPPEAPAGLALPQQLNTPRNVKFTCRQLIPNISHKKEFRNLTS